MFEICSDFISKVANWNDEFGEETSEWLGHDWTYYQSERAVLHGLPFAIVSTLFAAYFFDCTKMSSAAIFATVNYITLTSLSEIIRAHHHIDEVKAILIIGISGAVSAAFIRKICRSELSTQAAVILTIAAFFGQLIRLKFVSTE